jgi:hypothetical protein
VAASRAAWLVESLEMPALTRRREPDASREVWHVFYGDVQVGTIGERAGVPVDVDQCGWCCGFYPGVEPKRHADGTARTFKMARTAFSKAWRELLPTLSEANFQAWRDQRDWTAWKYQMHDCGCRMPTQEADGRSRCFYGVAIDIAGVERHIYTAHR